MHAHLSNMFVLHMARQVAHACASAQGVQASHPALVMLRPWNSPNSAENTTEIHPASVAPLDKARTNFHLDFIFGIKVPLK